MITPQDFDPQAGTGGNDTAAFLAAAAAAQTNCQELFIPAPAPSMYYRVTQTIEFSKPCAIRGEHPTTTIIGTTGFTLGQPIFDFKAGATILEDIQISNLTLRSDGTATGLRLANASCVQGDSVILYECYDGLRITSNGVLVPRGFSTDWRGIKTYNPTRHAVLIDEFEGGGAHTFSASTLNAPNGRGLYVTANSTIDTLNVTDGSVFEGCMIPVYLEGNVEAFNSIANRYEKNGVQYSNALFPAPGKAIRAANIIGNWGETDGEYDFVNVAYGGGTVHALNVTGNRIRDYARSLVRFSGAAYGGVVEGNSVGNLSVSVSNGPAPNWGIRVAGNVNDAGAIV